LSFSYHPNRFLLHASLAVQELADPQLDQTATEGHRWWGFNHLQVWSTNDINGDELKQTKRAVSDWGQYQEIEMYNDHEAETTWKAKYDSNNVNAPTHLITPIKNTHWTFSNSVGEKWVQSSNGNANTFRQVLGSRPDYRIDQSDSTDTNNIKYDKSLEEQKMAWATSEMHVSYDPNSPATKQINTMTLRLEQDEVRATGGAIHDLSQSIWEMTLDASSSHTINALEGAVVTQCQKSTPCITTNSQYRTGVLRTALSGVTQRIFIVSQRVGDFYLDGNGAKKVKNNNFRNNYDLKITGTNGVVTIPKADITKAKHRYFFDMSKQYTTASNAASEGGRGRFLDITFRLITVGRWNKNKIEVYATDERADDYASYNSDMVNKRTDKPRHRLHNHRKVFPESGTTYGASHKKATRNNPYSCEGDWTLLPNSVWLPEAQEWSGSGQALEQRTHGIACYIDVHLKRIQSWGQALELSFESDIDNPLDTEGNLASYFAVTNLRMFAKQKKQLEESTLKCPGDGCSGLLVGLINGESMGNEQYYGAMRQENFGKFL